MRIAMTQTVLSIATTPHGATGSSTAAPEGKRSIAADAARSPRMLRLLIAAALCLLACLNAACWSATASRQAATCKTDAECGSEFCDSGRCSQPRGVYGTKCIPAPHTPEGIRDGKLSTCGAYLCIDGRCRSCSSSAQCAAELGAPR